MRQYLKHISFRSKILTVLLLTTLLLSSFSFVLIQSIEQINKGLNEINKHHIPELVWISHWEDELHTKHYTVKQFVVNDLCCELVESYNSISREYVDTLLVNYDAIPAALEPLKSEIDLLDFKIENEIQGLLTFGDKEAVVNFIESQYFPHHADINYALKEAKETALESLTDQSENFSSIIHKSLYLLLFLTVGSIVISFVAAYRISGNVTKPLEQMVQKVDRIASGQYGLTVQSNDQVELQQLTSSINKMSTRLKDSFHTILMDKIYREQILNSLPVGIITIDEQSNEMSYNHAANFLLKDETPIHAPKNSMFWNVLHSKEIIQNIKVTFHSSKGEHALLVSQSELKDQHEVMIGRIFYFVDITETEKLEKRMHQSEKLALIGELAAGAAHEIRNPLAVIDGFLSIMNQSLSELEIQKYQVPLLLKELDRINSIVEEMLLLTKPSAPLLNSIRLEDVINEILPLIERSVTSEEVDFSIELHANSLLLDAKQMKQVFHNLIRNSIEAMSYKGTVSIYSRLTKDEYHIFVEDNGSGIPENLQESIFDPFLTSKEEGTGLGLTIVQKIIENHHGKIKLLSSTESGTIFKITLPLN
ncbi:ATP-binding protein [Alkalihalobacillus sp. MEB130]|uniref:sensor histidine kinase n=1 Tax=Alkalihalobacillus sp. MEB130 TaxID=2976704 RepID=UPI0028DE694D|nr:ATP-binding protein [Alkalihalobacillus sp. MEB130]MDT8861572.1 ATP-binding protein [Alkalihalobacillus sp. MEB130]